MNFDTLLAQAKSYLNFTWEDPVKSKRIEGYLRSSMAYLNDVAGKELDFESDMLANDLLMNRVLYMDSQALPDFNENYKGLLQELNIYGDCKEDNNTV